MRSGRDGRAIRPRWRRARPGRCRQRRRCRRFLPARISRSIGPSRLHTARRRARSSPLATNCAATAGVAHARPIRAGSTASPDHRSARAAFCLSRRASSSRRRLTGAHDGDRIRRSHHFVELVADEQDCTALVFQAPHQSDQLVDLRGAPARRSARRGSGRRRRDRAAAGSSNICLTWTGASATRCRQSIATPAIFANPFACAPAPLASRSGPPRPIGSRARIRFSSSVSGGASMNSWWTMPIPCAKASAGPVNANRSVVRGSTSALVGMVDALQYPHQRRFSRAVPADGSA